MAPSLMVKQVPYKRQSPGSIPGGPTTMYTKWLIVLRNMGDCYSVDYGVEEGVHEGMWRIIYDCYKLRVWIHRRF